MNAKKHGRTLPAGIDRYSSAPWFDGIHEHGVIDAIDSPSPVMIARTWLGGTGWRRRGLIQLDEKPS